jgi:hypothetical protein
MRRRGKPDPRKETDMYATLEDDIFLAPESIISGLLAADVADDEFNADAESGYAAAAEDLDFDTLGV